MATPRKHWFRVADSLTQEPLSNDELATLIRLMGELNQRWARDGLTAEEACSIVLRPGDLMSCTGSGSLARARRVINALASHVSLTVDTQGANTSIKWPKWSEFQNLTTPTPGNPRAKASRESPPPPPPPQDAPAPATKGEKESAPTAPAADAATSPPDPPEKLRPKPESFDEPERKRIRKWADSKGWGPAVLNAGLERFREWEPLKRPRRTSRQWVSAFQRITRESVEAGKIPLTGDAAKPKGQAYADADEMLARRRREYEAEVARSEPEDPEAIGRVIDLGLRAGCGDG